MKLEIIMNKILFIIQRIKKMNNNYLGLRREESLLLIMSLLGLNYEDVFIYNIILLTEFDFYLLVIQLNLS